MTAAAAMALALLAPAPAQRVEAETLRPGVVVADGRALALPRVLRVDVQAPAPTRARVRARAPGCAGRLLGRRVGSRWRTISVALAGGRQTLTLRRGRCPVWVDRIDVGWAPAPRTTWQWQLSGPLDLSVDAELFDLDLFATSPADVARLHAAGRRVVCYFSAGTFERGRPDAAAFPRAVVGEPLEDWPDERWLDVRRLDVLGPILERRLDRCAGKGFDGVEADNVDGYANRSGFPLRPADQLRFNRFLAREAHARGLSIGLKNDLEQAAALEPAFDWALNEQCFQYRECERLRPFTAAGKAVFVVEYELAPSAFCAAARAAGFMAIRKRLELDAPREPCW